ncbi:RDD family protein [Saprospira sp. CCB-QB6]|uniref:RDD family protein n=1 Tax=Saprospira sp. CCB-QB6 TaxID=3023936 RepID=UPI002349F811|nr:RDD family protein [Saprospira sp. CCB-QB6]WCL82670.1 RDD family protein [Saprospira sp. CCB-QB6]
MKTIEITTAQKVSIQYELAPLGSRISAFMVDMLILIGILIVLNLIAGVVVDGGAYMYFAILVVLPTILFYTLVSEILLDGQTIGKRAVGLRIIKLNGEPAEAFDYVLRWAFRFIDIWGSAGSVASLMISSSAHSQRMGDLLSGSTVVRKKASRQFRLEDILSLAKKEGYEPKYPEVLQLSEQDMLFVKKVIDRHKKYKNKAHKKVIVELSEHLSQQLEVPLLKNRLEFLRQLLLDYIVLTR